LPGKIIAQIYRKVSAPFATLTLVIGFVVMMGVDATLG
jgi:hypothetical protein